MTTKIPSKRFRGVNEVCRPCVDDYTFDNYLSSTDSKFIVNAVGEILLEFQKFIYSDDAEQDFSNSTPVKREKSIARPRLNENSNFKAVKNFSDDENNIGINDINEPTDKTYHRRVLDSEYSKNKKPVDCKNGSLNWKELESNKFCVNDETCFHRPMNESEHHIGFVNPDNVPCRSNVYSVNRLKLSISGFVVSFYKHYPIISYSSFILSLIYIDRFLKSQCEDSNNLTKFSITRLFLVSIIIAMKFHEEYYIENRYFFKQASKYCLIKDIKELNILENIFLEAIDYRLMVSKQEQEKYFKLIYNRSLELQFKQFRVYEPNYKIIDDYFKAPKKEIKVIENSKQPPVFFNGKLFKDSDEVMHFFHCEEIYEDKTNFSDSSSLYTLSEGSPKLKLSSDFNL